MDFLADLLAACLGNVPQSIKHGIVIAGRTSPKLLATRRKWHRLGRGSRR
jgi:hypothetical protein